MRAHAYLFLAAGLFAAFPRFEEKGRDEVRLKDGRLLHGNVVYEDDAQVLLRTGTREQWFATAEIESVRSVERSLARWIGRRRAIDSDPVRAHLELAKWCDAEGLAAEARLERLDVVRLDSANEEAHLALGHRRSASGWLLPYRNQWWTLERLEKTRADWNDAWETETEHYRVRTNLGFASAIDAAVDLEYFLHDFVAAFGKALTLRAPAEPMSADLHRDRDSFPQTQLGVLAYFDPTENRLRLCATAGVRGPVLFHEATHQILHTTAARARSGAGEVPGWLSEGLAEYVAAGVSGDPGRLAFRPEGKALHHFREHAVAEKPLGLTRVLNLEAGDFLASSRSALKVAQAYTLVHFSLHGEEGKHRDRFLAFVAGAYRGRASSADFKRTVADEEAAFEKAWHAYAKAQAATK